LADINAICPDEIDAILLAGDIDIGERLLLQLARIWKVWRKPVIAVNGNHEFYGSETLQDHVRHQASIIARARGMGMDIDILNRGTRIIGDTKIIGATLWTDMDYGMQSTRSRILKAVEDYRAIDHRRADGTIRPHRISDTVRMHREDFSFIMQELRKSWNGKRLVLTHHAPVIQVVHPERMINPSSIEAAFSSDLWGKIRQSPVDVWIHGHLHQAREDTLAGDHGPVSFVSNMRGFGAGNGYFSPYRVLDSQAPVIDLSKELLPLSGILDSMRKDESGPSPSPTTRKHAGAFEASSTPV